MDQALDSLTMETYTMVNGKMAKEMDKVHASSIKAAITKEIGSRTK